MSGSGSRLFEDSDDELGRTKITSYSEVARESGRSMRAHLLMLNGTEVGKVFPLEAHEVVLGRSQTANLRLDDDSISRSHCRVLRIGAEFAVEDLRSSNGTYVNDERITRAVLKDGDKLRVGETTVLRFSFSDRLDEDFHERMYDAALRDALTGAFNKRYFLESLTKEIRFAARHRTALCLVMLDLDHFKRINDTYGHLAGDRVLTQLGKLALGLLRSEDVFARYGGEEFGVIARAISLEQGGLLAERLRAKVESTPFDLGDRTIQVTSSLGVALWEPHMTEPLELVAAADEALYAAKREGRNRYVLQTPSNPASSGPAASERR